MLEIYKMNSVLIVFLGALSFSVGAKVELREGIVPKKLPPHNDPLTIIPWQELRQTVLAKNAGDGGANAKAGSVEADITEYVLEILKNVQRFMIEDGVDPLQLSDQFINVIPLGFVNITSGWLQQLSTITLSDAAIAKFNMDEDVLEITLPLAFESLLISYHYHTQVLLVGVDGGVEAKITNVKLNLHLGINFTELHAFVDKADITDSGSITITYTGLAIVDWVLDLLTNAFTTLFHGLILDIVELYIQDPVEKTVDKINEVVDGIFGNNTTPVYV